MILIIGSAGGQLASSLEAAAAARGMAARRVGRPDADFDHPDTIRYVFDAAAPSLVINAAAYTAVDRAETEPEAAMRANRDGPALLARLCADTGVGFIHVSTDYVFDGDKGAPYVETDKTNPTGVYGATKLAGEHAVLEALPSAVVLRTSWVYAATGKNFVRTMLNAAARGVALRVVADQRGCPTNAGDLADAILTLAARPALIPGGIYHAAGSGDTTWHGLASAAIGHAAAKRGETPPEIAAIRTEDWPTPARRPADSRLDCAKLAAAADGLRLPDWRPSLARTVDAILAAG